MSRFNRAASGAAPKTRISPLLGWIRSATTRRKVDLPQPDGPSSVRNSPTPTSRLSPCNAVIARRSVKKRTCRLRQLTARPADGGATLSARGGALATAFMLSGLLLTRGLRRLEEVE